MSTRLVRSLTAMALLAPLALAQTGGDTPAPAAKPPAPAPQAAPAPSLTAPQVPVTGLTAENAPKVTKALQDYANNVYKCGACSDMSAHAGKCCGKEMTSSSGAAFAMVKADPTSSAVTFTVAPSHEIKLSEIERILTANSVKVARDKLSIGTNAQLVIANVADQQAADVIKKALIDAKLFDQIEAEIPAGQKEAHFTVLKSGTSAPTEARVKETLAKANSAASLADIAWTAPAKS
jgi:hypothetical protein